MDGSTSQNVDWDRSGRDSGRRRLSVGAKFGLIVALCTAIVMAASIAAITQRIQAQDTIQSEEIARTTAARICSAVRGVFESAFDIVDTTHDNMIAFKDGGITDPRVYDATLKRMIDADRYGAWMAWDAADAPLDASAEAKSRRDAAGRFSTYWHQNGMEMLRDGIPAQIYDNDLYKVPHDDGQSYLLEPHSIDAVDGDATLVTSFSKPLEHDGKVVGVLAVDVKLDAIADALAAITLPDHASITVVSDGGVVAMSTTQGWSGRSLGTLSPPLARLLERAKRGGDGSSLVADGSNRLLTSWMKVRFRRRQEPLVSAHEDAGAVALGHDVA